MASYLHNAPLVEGQGAERAGAKAAPVGNQAEFDFLNGGDAARFGIAGVPGALVGKVVYRVHLLRGQGLLGRVLHHIFPAIGFCQPLGGEGVAVAVLDFEGLRVLSFVGFQFRERGQNDGGQAFVQFGCPEHGAINVGDVPDVHAGIESVGNLHDALFSHAVHEQIRLRIKQYGALHALGPIVVMGKAA